MHKKMVCILLSLLLCLLCGCQSLGDGLSEGSGQLPEQYKGSYRLHLLCNETDTFNPYTVTAKENQEICYLLFDPLVTLDSKFEPVLKIAENVKQNGTTYTVKLKNVLFSDGTRLTSEDVVYSMELAKKSSVRYADQLKSVVSQSTAGSDTVTIKLDRTDPFFTNMLDFPIIKKGSENRKSDDNITLPPIGAGRYVLNDARNTLTENPNYYGGRQVHKVIDLINAPGSESISHYVSSGVVSICYSDYSDNTMPRMSGRKISVPLNNLVYLGINMSDPLLKEQHLRYALASAVDREELVKEAYYGNGIAATGPFNPIWKHVSGYQTLETKANNEITIVNLEKIGYNSIDNDGYRANAAGKHITLSLLVNSDNQARVAAANLIVKRLADVGIEIKIRSADYATYLSELHAGRFDLYLGEVKLTNNMDLSALVGAGGSLAFGVPKETSSSVTSSEMSSVTSSASVAPSGINLTAADAVKGFYTGRYTLGDVATAFQSEMPIVPLLYRSGVAMFAPAFENEPEVSISDLFLDINNYSFVN